MQTDCVVAIQCITYNHEPYIRKCLDGFVMQKTNFRFVAIVHDDASTDGTTDIIREYAAKYPDIIKPIFETENQYSKHDGSLGRIMRAAIDATGCTYVAMCEGDDYWIDPLKLQKQVDFLEANPKYGMVYGDVKYYDAYKQRFVWRAGQFYSKYNTKAMSYNKQRMFDAIMFGVVNIKTLTVLLNRSTYNSIVAANTPSFLMGETPLFLVTSQVSNIGYIDDVFGVYVLHEGSATHQNQIGRKLFEMSACNMRVYYCNQYGYKIKNTLKRRYNKAYYDLKDIGLQGNARFHPFVMNRMEQIVFALYRRMKNSRIMDVLQSYTLSCCRLMENYMWRIFIKK